MGEILNISAARGSAKSFDFASAALAADDKLVFKATNGQAPLLVKMNKNFGGDDSQITITAGTKATVLLSISELDLLQTCNYQLFKITDLAVTLLFSGTFTITGDKTNQALAVSSAVPFQNGSNIREIDGSQEFMQIIIKDDDDYVILHPSEANNEALTVIMPNPTLMKGKKITLKNLVAPFIYDVGPRELIITDGIFSYSTPNYKDIVTYISNGNQWDVWQVSNEIVRKNPGRITDVDYTVAPGNDLLIVDAVTVMVHINLPEAEPELYDKKIDILVASASGEFPVLINGPLGTLDTWETPMGSPIPYYCSKSGLWSKLL